MWSGGRRSQETCGREELEADWLQGGGPGLRTSPSGVGSVTQALWKRSRNSGALITVTRCVPWVPQLPGVHLVSAP